MSPDGWCWWGFVGPGRWPPLCRVMPCCGALLGGRLTWEHLVARSCVDSRCPEGVELIGALGCGAALCRYLQQRDYYSFATPRHENLLCFPLF